MTNQYIQFLPDERLVPISGEESVLEVALKNAIDISHSCGGMGSCTTCRVFIERCPSPLPARNELEQEVADSRGFKPFERLSCQLAPLGGLVVRVPEPLLSPAD